MPMVAGAEASTSTRPSQSHDTKVVSSSTSFAGTTVTAMSAATNTGTVATNTTMEQQQGLQKSTPRKDRVKSFFSSGRDFYDDGYTDEEQDLADLPTTVTGLLGAARFFGRQKDVEAFERAHDDIMQAQCKDGSLSYGSANSTDNAFKVSSKDFSLSGTNLSPSAASSVVTRVLRTAYPAILVWGISGTGKSTLVDHFFEKHCDSGWGDSRSDSKAQPQSSSASLSSLPSASTRPCYILRGKYDEYTGQSEPFSAIVQALNAFSQQLMAGPEHELDRIRKAVRRAFRSNSAKSMAMIDESKEMQLEDDGDDDQAEGKDDPDTDASRSDTPRKRRKYGKRRRHQTGGDSCDKNTGNKDDTIPTTQDSHNDDGNDDSGDETDDGMAVLESLVRVVPSLSFLLQQNSSPRGQSHMTDTLQSLRRANRSGFTRTTNSHRNIANSNNSSSDCDAPDNQMATTSIETVWNQFQYIFLQFLKAISTAERPIYLFLDDLQWSSEIGLKLLANVLSDPELKHFILIASIRQETNPHNSEVLEVPMDEPLRTVFLDRLQEAQLHQLTISNLTKLEMSTWLSSLLDREEEDLSVLVDKVHDKTDGNIYFAVQVLEELECNNILVYSRISFQWEFNFCNDTNPNNGDGLRMSDNIVSAIESKLRQLPKPLQQVLSIAAYIRASFDVHVLEYIMANEHNHADGILSWKLEDDAARRRQQLCDLLEQAVLERLITNSIGGTTYRFAHDRIQQAAHGMVPFGEIRDKLRVRIGHCLFRIYQHGLPGSNNSISNSNATSNGKGGDDQEGAMQTIDVEDGLLFVAADHLNSVQTKDHMFSVTMNLEVGERALEMAALAPAAVYLQKAIQSLRLVRNDPWDAFYDTCLRLYRARCDVELSLGRLEIGHNLATTVIEKCRTLEDRLPTYHALARAFGRQGKNQDSLSISLHAVTEMKQFPSKWKYLPYCLTNIRRIKRYLNRYSNDEILASLPTMTNQTKIMTMKLCKELSVRAYLTKNMLLWLVNLCKLMRTTMRYGLCMESANGFVAFALLMGRTGNQDMALRCADLGQRTLKKVSGSATMGWIYMLTGSFINSFHTPVTELIANFRKGYSKSMENGEFEFGFLCWQSCIMMAFQAGYPLPSVMESVESLVQQCKVYNVNTMSAMAPEHITLIRYLTQTDEVVDWDKLEESAANGPSTEDAANGTGFALHYNHSLILATLFGKYELAQKLADRLVSMASHDKSFMTLLSRGLYPGIVAAELYRRTGQRQHLRRLRTILKEARFIARTYGNNFVHHVLLLEAEEKSIRKREKESHSIRNAYDIAIMVANNASCYHTAALANELAGEHYVRHGLKHRVGKYFANAVLCYAEWGCTVKVKRLKQTRKEYLKELGKMKSVTLLNDVTAPGLSSAPPLQDLRGDGRGDGSGADNNEAICDFGNPSVAGRGGASQRTKPAVLPTFRPSTSHISSSIAETVSRTDEYKLGTEELGGGVGHGGDNGDDVSVLTDGSSYK